MNTQINDAVFEQFPFLESERLIFRNFETDDAAGLFKLRSHPEVIRYMDMHPQKNIQEATNFVSNNQQAFANKNGINWVIQDKASGNFMGYFGYWRLMRHKVRAEIGYAILPEYWSKGYMSECMQVLLPFGFLQLNVHSIEANVNPNNKASIQLLEKQGFRLEAHFKEDYFFDGQFLDSKIYSLLEHSIRHNID